MLVPSAKVDEMNIDETKKNNIRRGDLYWGKVIYKNMDKQN
jgi:hypothetical protein